MRTSSELSGERHGGALTAHAPRYRAIAESVARFCPEGRVLDVGCGEAILLEYLPPGVKYIGIEPSARAAALARAKYIRFGILHCAPETFEPNDYRWDCIIFNEALGYAPHPRPLLEKYARLLRPKGVMIVSAEGRRTLATNARLARWLKWWRTMVCGRSETSLHELLLQHGWPIAESKTVSIPGTRQHWTIWTAEPQRAADPAGSGP